MRPLDIRADLALTAFLAVGLCLAILAAAAGLRWLSTNWTTSCPRLLHMPVPPGSATPWRVSAAQAEPPCIHRP